MRKVFTLLIALLFATLSSWAQTTTVRLYAADATTVGGIATSSQQLIGTGAWKNDQSKSKMELYLPLTSLGTFTIDDIASLQFSTKKALPIPGTPNLDFFWAIYTNGTKYSWYEERLISEPMYYNGFVSLYDAWTNYKSVAGSNQMTFFDSHYGSMGWYGAPTLADLKAGSINWAAVGGTATTNIDYGAQTVKFISISTGSSWNATMISYLDNIIITLSNGKVLIVDLEERDQTPVTTIVPKSSPCGTLDVEVKVSDFKNVGNVSLTLNYDASVLSYSGVDINPALTSAFSNGAISSQFILGRNSSSTGVTVADNEVLFTLHFNVLPAAVGGNTTNLTWSTVAEECQYSSPGTEPLIYNSTFTDGSATIPVRPVVNTSLGLSYCTIQAAIDGSSAGNVITVAAGTYAENIIVDESVTLLGPNANVSGCGGVRVAEAIIVPATNLPAGGEIIHVAASNVTIKGFTLDGDNPALPTNGYGFSGADMHAAEGITVYETLINNLTVSNNIFQNLTYFGVTLYDYPAGVPSTGHTISNNKFLNLGTYNTASGNANWGGGVLLYNNQYTAVTNNCMTNVRLGIQTGNFSQANPGDPAYQVISGNTIEARKRGIFHNLAYGGASPYTLSNNNITGLANVNETTFWDGILFSSMSVASTASGNMINGSGVTAIPTTGIPVWNCQTAPMISGGTISGVGLGINVNNFESYPTAGSNAGNTSATINGVAISGTTIAGIKVHDNPLNTNGAIVTAEVKNVTITVSPTGIWVTGADAGANIHDNIITASAAGINVTGTVTSPTKGLAISNNQVTLTSQLAGSTPTVGIALSNVSGTAAATVSGNTVTNPFYGYTVYALSTSPVTTITGGTITGIMQGVAAFNSNGILPAPSTFGVSSMAISGFAGSGTFQAGVYVYTGGSNPLDVITATVDKVSVTGTGKSPQDCAGFSFADFSTGTGIRQNITVTECTLTDNKNRGINVRGANAEVTILRSTLSGNGSDAFGTGGNDGFGITAFAGGKATVQNCFITNPASSTTTVSALFTFPLGTPSVSGTINATNNSLNRNGNGWLANNAGGTLNATCNWLGSTNPATNAAAISGTVAYMPWLCSGVDQDLVTAGFQGVPCGADAPLVGPDGAGNVECVSAAIAPTTPVVKDVDGITNLVPVLVSTTDSPNPISCAGTRTYTYTYTNCAGTSATWKYVYAIQHVTPPVVPVDGASVVECLTGITTPIPPSTVVDVCGVPVPAVAAIPAFVDNPATITCEGTRTYTFTYTDCQGLVSTWKYVYTIKHLTPPSEIGGPAASASTVECVSSAVVPTTLPVVQDVCGNVLTPGTPVKQIANTLTFDQAVVLSETAGPGVWYTDRYNPAGFATASFDGGNRLKHSLSASDGAGSRPSAFSSAFYNTQGRGYDLGVATDAVEVKLYIPAAWATSNKRMAGLWGVPVNAANAVSGYPIVEFTSDGNNPRFQVYEASGAWVNIGLPAGVYDTWVTLKIRLLPSGEFLCSAGSINYVTKLYASNASVRFKSAILQGHNYDPVTPTNGVTYDIYWDDFTWNDNYSAICEGKITYTYPYQDCAGLPYAWVYTYTVDDNTGPTITAPANVTVHVNSGCNATGVALGTPTVSDACGGATTFENDAPTLFPVGSTTVTWTAKDCAGNESTAQQTVTVLKNTLSGTLVYNNSPKTPMNLVKLVLKDAGGVQVGSEVTTASNGAFSFTDLCAGTYTVHVTDNQKDAGGINSTDAGAVNAWSAFFGSIEHVKFLAGDVVKDDFIASDDALKIQRYFVFKESFNVATPKWSYWKKGELIINNSIPYPSTGPWPTTISVTMTGDVTNLELYGMLTGDFNGSLIPTMSKSASPALTLDQTGYVQAGANQVVELPLRAGSNMEVTAISMILKVPSNMVNVQEISIIGSSVPASWAVNGDELRIGWNSLTPVRVEENKSLIILKLMTTGDFTPGQSMDLLLPYNPLNELAGGNREAMPYASLKVAKVGNGLSGISNLNQNNGLKLENYPNPFNRHTTIDYSLPVEGKVTLDLYNSLGQLVSVLVDARQKSGDYSLRVDGSTLTPGLYVARLRLTDGGRTMVGTIKLNLQK